MKKAFINPASGELRCHGFVETNGDGDIGIDVPDEFNLMPGEWRWNGKEFEPYKKPIPFAEKRRAGYVAKGATIEALVTAMWEKDATEIARLEAIRQQVKREIPK